MRAIEEALELAIIATSSPSSKEQYNAAYEACVRALVLLRSMEPPNLYTMAKQAKRKKAAPKAKEPERRSNLYLRNLTNDDYVILNRIGAQYRCKTRAAQIARAILDWSQLQAETQRLRDRCERLEDAVSVYTRANRAAVKAMDVEAEAIAALFAADKLRGTNAPRQLQIPTDQ